MATQSVITVQPFTITPGDDANTVYSKYHEHCVNTLTEDGNYDVNIGANLKANLKNIAPEKDTKYKDGEAKTQDLKTAKDAYELTTKNDADKAAYLDAIVGTGLIGGRSRKNKKSKRGGKSRRGKKRSRKY